MRWPLNLAPSPRPDEVRQSVPARGPAAERHRVSGDRLALILAPEWFFTNIGTFPPFNRHYAGDFGSFLLPLGAAFLYAARNPAQDVGLLGVAAGAGLFHALNHVYDTLRGTGGWDQTLALLLFAGLTLAALWQVLRYGNRSSATVGDAVPSAAEAPVS